MLINQNDFITPDLICGLAAVVVYVLEDKCIYRHVTRGEQKAANFKMKYKSR